MGYQLWPASVSIFLHLKEALLLKFPAHRHHSSIPPLSHGSWNTKIHSSRMRTIHYSGLSQGVVPGGCVLGGVHPIPYPHPHFLSTSSIHSHFCPHRSLPVHAPNLLHTHTPLSISPPVNTHPCPHQMPKCMLGYTPWTDRHLRKHYLPATLFVGGN